MNNIDIKQQINVVEQELLNATAKIADLEKKIQEHGVGLSFNAVGKTDLIYKYEKDLQDAILYQTKKQTEFALLSTQSQR
jgi:hypothetical protein